MSVELLKVVKEDVNYLVYFNTIRYGFYVIVLIALIGIPIVYFYNKNLDIAMGIIIGMFWLSVVRMIGFSFKKNDA
jgi:ABC-type spermidine/putrescine transport system permease subunit I